ncbi:hypothetical protein [Nocardioides jiangxiensis]|uniref:DUF485 domain-containing protein n=1 Tax=Nocardioides jiangxiensis TaxID=3064524 RepID=A0ABT9B0S9_9ACTN|nr:hypothetical protein [Nocardioides sp. WY-20]MDO7868460.1 hypothetical protein [Nocardioides sp. WY-20]
MSDIPPPPRVRVTGPPRHTTRRTPLPRAREIDAATPVGEIYLGSLLREQARLAARILAVLFGVLGSVPLVFHLWPALAAHRVVGVPVAWWVLGVLAYPFLLLLGWAYVRRAERNERDFAALVDVVAEEP